MNITEHIVQNLPLEESHHLVYNFLNIGGMFIVLGFIAIIFILIGRRPE